MAASMAEGCQVVWHVGVRVCLEACLLFQPEVSPSPPLRSHTDPYPRSGGSLASRASIARRNSGSRVLRVGVPAGLCTGHEPADHVIDVDQDPPAVIWSSDQQDN